ncbi:hypothetical protein [Halpernia sp.]|uniref:hypothetical protein n=1 Tax=Halpernia sp. TaxID=2782209 RepID=UPI003A955AE9
MEDFDIEKLERKTPYEIPINTFEQVQKRVLEETINKRKSIGFSKSWVYAAAAVFLLLMGIGFILNTNNREISAKKNQIAVNNEIISTENTPNSFADTTQKKNSENAIKTNLDLTSTRVKHLNIKEEVQNNNLALQKVNKNMQNSPIEDKVDKVLDNFSSTEIAAFTNNTEQDVYLDLYN